MTNTELSAIRARCEAATPGPWVFDDRPFSYGLGIVGHNGEKVMDDGSAGGEYAETTTMENMRFICAAKADIPALLAHIEAQRATLAKAEADKALPRALVWTTEPPKEAGQYYWALYQNLMVGAVQVVRIHGELHALIAGSKNQCPLSDFIQWAGPIPTPREPTE